MGLSLLDRGLQHDCFNYLTANKKKKEILKNKVNSLFINLLLTKELYNGKVKSGNEMFALPLHLKTRLGR